MLLPHLAVINFYEATFAKELALAKHTDVLVADMYCLLSQTALPRYPRYLVIEDASDAAFRLCSLQKLSHSLMLLLRWYVRLSFLRSLEEAFSNNENIVVCDPLTLQNLSTGCLFSL